MCHYIDLVDKGHFWVTKQCQQLLEIYWNLKTLLEILQMSLNLMVLLEIFYKMIDRIGFWS